MRRLAYALFAATLLVLLPSPSQAYGTASCGDVFQCPTSRDAETNRYVISKIVEQSNLCIANNFGESKEGGFFELSMGLDARNCLRTKRIDRDSAGRLITPKCCAKPISPGSQACRIYCELHVTQ